MKPGGARFSVHERDREAEQATQLAALEKLSNRLHTSYLTTRQPIRHHSEVLG
jgi:hypothetical protein